MDGHATNGTNVLVPDDAGLIAPLSGMDSTSYDAAPDLAPLGTVHVLQLLSADECGSIIAAAEKHTWRARGDYQGHITIDIDVLPWLGDCAKSRFLPPLAALFHASSVQIASLRIVKYSDSADDGDSYAGLPLHEDGTPLSFICALNHCAEAGTYVRALGRVISPPAGHAILFCGRWLHAGVPVRKGTTRYVLTGFVNATFGPTLEATLERVVAREMDASVGWRLCPAHRWLRREYAAFCAGERACTSCGVVVPPHAVRHCCDDPECCGTRICDACLGASAAAVDHHVDDELDAAADAQVCLCEFVGDDGGQCDGDDGTLLVVEPGRAFRRCWRLSMARRLGGASWALGDPSRRPRLVRSDHDCDEAIGSRCLGEAAMTLLPHGACEDGEMEEADQDDEESFVDAAVELRAPRRPGAYRLFFRLVVGAGALPVGGTDQLTADFRVVG